MLKLLVFTLLVPCTVTVWLPFYYLYPGVRSHFPGVGLSAVAGIIFIALGAMGYLWCALDFVFVGKGTPTPIDHPKVLVVCGLYKFVRNPMYVSVSVVLLGESLAFRSVALLRYALVMLVIFHLVVILMEEPMLRNKFGASYEEYCRDVPRWIPRLGRSPGK